MQNKVFLTMDEAVADIPDGVTIMIPGFGGVGQPKNLVAALYRQGAKDITGISNGAGGLNVLSAEPDAPPDMGSIIAAKRVRKMICAFTAPTHPSRKTDFDAQYEAGEIEAETVHQGTLAERIRAGGAGIPAFYTPTSVGTELAVDKEHREFNGRTYVLEHALFADYTLVRAWKADSFGNLIFRRSQRNFNPIMATAAQCTIVEVEEPIVEPGEFDPDTIHLSGIYVSRIVKIPPPPEGIWDKPRPIP